MLAASQAFGLGEKSHVITVAEAGSFALVSGKTAAAVYVDDKDWPGVAWAVGSLAGDVDQVTGLTPHIVREATGPDIVVVGTIGRSALIDRLIAEQKLDVSAIRGRWEMSVTQIFARPFPGVRSALVIAVADKPGTIFGVYDLSEQIGFRRGTGGRTCRLRIRTTSSCRRNAMFNRSRE